MPRKNEHPTPADGARRSGRRKDQHEGGTASRDKAKQPVRGTGVGTGTVAGDLFAESGLNPNVIVHDRTTAQKRSFDGELYFRIQPPYSPTRRGIQPPLHPPSHSETYLLGVYGTLKTLLYVQLPTFSSQSVNLPPLSP